MTNKISKKKGKTKKEMDNYVENKLFELIDKGDMRAISFYLKTQHPKYNTIMDSEERFVPTKEEKERANKALKDIND